MQRITPHLWYDAQAEEAAALYVSIFPNSSIDHVAHYGDAGPGRAGSVMTVAFTLDGQGFLALNGGPRFRFNEALSLLVSCETQAEIDHYWQRLSGGGEEGPCGWLKDRFGLSWQVTSAEIGTLLGGHDAAARERVMSAFLQMRKVDIAALRAAAAAA